METRSEETINQKQMTKEIMTSVQLIRAIELLTKARDQVGLKLYQEIKVFLTGVGSEDLDQTK